MTYFESYVPEYMEKLEEDANKTLEDIYHNYFEQEFKCQGLFTSSECINSRKAL